MKKQLLYKNLSKYYDLIYSGKDYKKEVKNIKSLIKKYKKSSGKDLLEVACGSGKHLEYLKKDFNCVGLDINKDILNQAKKSHKGIKFKQGNMIDFELNKEFDVITCLFSSIGYVKTYHNLNKTIKNFSKHLKQGGVLIIEPWLTKENFKSGLPHMVNYEDKNLSICRANISKKKGNISILDFHYLIAEKNSKDVKYFFDRHEMGLFDINKTLNIMNKTDLKSKYLQTELMTGRGIFVGIKKWKSNGANY